MGKNSIVGVILADTTSYSSWISQDYTLGQIVSYSGNLYSCILGTTGAPIPTNLIYWTPGYQLTVSPTVIDYVAIGYYINIFDGVNNNSLNRILSIIGNNIYTEYAPINSYSAMTPSYIMMSIYVIKDLELSAGCPQLLGSTRITSATLPANTTVTIDYTNNGTVNQRFVGRVEYLY